MINNKGTLSDQIAEISKKVKGAITRILAEAGNKEFKGIKMRPVWQMVKTTIIPILTYACESWKLTKEVKGKLQTIFNDAIKTILYLLKCTPTTIILRETGNLPMEHIIIKKQLLQAKRIDEMKDEAPIIDATKQDQSSWRNMIDEIAVEYHVKEIMGITK